ncbi:MAG: hypothetical protein JW918_03980 [Anaerolineae bacterium]|nr:hypothetical protein [Anaerolineae bacterium]
MKKTLLYTILGIVVLILASCKLAAEQAPVSQLMFEAPYAIGADQELHVSLGVYNAGTQEFAGDDRFEGQMEIRDASGELRASAEVLELPAIPVGDTAWPLAWHGELSPGAYCLTWGSDKYGFINAEFSIVERNGRLYLAEDAPVEESTEAERLTERAIADLADRLGIDAGQIVVESVTPTEFPDASLGVPEPGMSYAQVVTPGYVIRLKVGEQAYEYHAAGERVVLATDGAASSEYRLVEITEAGLRFEVPANWQQLAPEMLWMPEGDGGLRLGFTWMDLEPPMEPEAAMLPAHAQIVASEPIILGWGDGRSFTLEVYGPAVEGGDKAPIKSVETHVIVVIISSDDVRRGFDFYTSAPTVEHLAELEPALRHALETAALCSPGAASESRTTGWPVLRDETYGFQLAYPGGWTYKDLDVQGAGMPDDWPVERTVIFYPEAWADRFDLGGPPDPDAPPAIPALSLEVCVGPEAQFRRAYVEPVRSEMLTINGVEVVREESGSGEYVTVMYVFQDPANPDVRVVLVDNLSKFADRAAEYPDIVELIPTVVSTFELAR